MRAVDGRLFTTSSFHAERYLKAFRGLVRAPDHVIEALGETEKASLAQAREAGFGEALWIEDPIAFIGSFDRLELYRPIEVSPWKQFLGLYPDPAQVYWAGLSLAAGLGQRLFVKGVSPLTGRVEVIADFVPCEDEYGDPGDSRIEFDPECPRPYA